MNSIPFVRLHLPNQVRQFIVRQMLRRVRIKEVGDTKFLLDDQVERPAFEIENEVGLTEGNIFQGELTIDQLLFNRPFPGYAQYRMPVNKLYMCGSSTHPGGGVSSACGANAAREILLDLKRPNTVPKDDCYDE